MTRRARLVLLLGLIAITAGCGSSGPTPTSSIAPVVSFAATPSVPSSSAASGRPTVSQTDTDWGRIWDSLPSSFPAVPGGTPDENAAGGPASAVFVVEGVDAKGVATVLQTQLQKAGYTTIGSLDPLEDGSVVLEMTGKPEGCMVQATATPTGGLTTIRILYGADCPYG